MMAAQSVDQHFAESMARAKARIEARKAQISTSPRPVIEAISSPVIVPDPVVVCRDAPKEASTVVNAGLDASSEALQRLGYVWLGGVADKVLLVIALAIKAGREDLTRSEILPLYNAHYGESKSDGWISARVNTLLDQKRISIRPQRRLCTVSKSGVAVGAVYVVAKQTRMTW